jgi:hypothetical protein
MAASAKPLTLDEALVAVCALLCLTHIDVQQFTFRVCSRPLDGHALVAPPLVAAVVAWAW